MTIDEMIIQVRVTADGVRDGVSAAVSELRKLEAAKEKLKEILELRIKAPDVQNLKEDLEGLKNNTLFSAGGQKSKNELLEKELKLLRDKKALTETTVSEEIEALERIRSLYAKTADEKLDIDKQIYSLRRSLNNEWFNDEMAAIGRLNAGRADRTDFQGMIDAYQELRDKVVEIYADYPETMRKALEEIDKKELAAAQSRAVKVVNIEKEKVDEQLKQLERINEYFKAKDGLASPDGETFEYGTQGVIGNLEQQIAVIEGAISALLDKAGGDLSRLNAEEKDYYDELVNKKEDYYHKLSILDVRYRKEEQDAREKALQEEQKQAEKVLKIREDAAKKANEAYFQGIKDRYSEEIRLAEEAANAEIAIYSDRIKAIDALLQSESRADTDAEQLDKIKRLQEQLAYETDDSNRYELQKEIQQQQDDYDKRKRKESLEDEKASLQEQINATKDALSERKQALQDLRDEEIRLAEESLENYIASLNAQTKELEKKEEKDTQVIKDELDIRAEDAADFRKEEMKQEESNNNEKRKLLSRTTDNIISDLYKRIADFAAAGRAAGQAWADAYSSAVSGISSAVNGTSGTPSPTSAGISSYNIEIEQNYNVPAVSPAQSARETEYLLEDLLRSV